MTHRGSAEEEGVLPQNVDHGKSKTVTSAASDVSGEVVTLRDGSKEKVAVGTGEHRAPTIQAARSTVTKHHRGVVQQAATPPSSDLAEKLQGIKRAAQLTLQRIGQKSGAIFHEDTKSSLAQKPAAHSGHPVHPGHASPEKATEFRAQVF